METIKRALEAVQHIYLCEDEGMASGQPTKEDYLEARELVAAALSELEGSKPKDQGAEPVDEERDMADHYLYMGWLAARPDGPMTDSDVRDAFLHALKYARAHPSPSAREKAMEEAIDKLLPLAQRIQAACEDGDVLNYDNEYDQRDAIEYEKVIAEAIAAKSTK